MAYIIEKDNKKLKCKITLPASKSISNRLLVIRALSPGTFRIQNLSTSDDTKVLREALEGKERIIDIGHAGTSMRFLTAYFSLIDGERILTGSGRMKNRPVGKLVEALMELGADIRYLEKEGFPPLLIRGKKLSGGKLTIDSSVSSQFISALLMIAPALEEGIHLELTGRTVSTAYIHLTLSVMQYFGIKYEWTGRQIFVGPQVYQPKEITVEADWSAASYWYEMAAIAENPEIMIHGLSAESLQGDSVLPDICQDFGIQTDYFSESIKLTKKSCVLERFDHDFTDHPDLVQTFAVLCGLLGIPFHFTGTSTLKVKETDRINALQNELARFGIFIQSADDGNSVEFNGKFRLHPGKIKVNTYQDHRMAMAFSPAAILGYKVVIDNPGVVSKSYPGFWEDLKQAGFKIT